MRELEADIGLVEQGLKMFCHVIQAAFVQSVDETDLPLGMCFGKLKRATAIGGPGPVFLEIVVLRVHILTHGHPDAGQVRVSLQQLSSALTDVGACRLVLRPGLDAVFAFGSGKENVPGEDKGSEATLMAVFHDLLPKGDLPVDAPVVDLCFVALLIETGDTLDGDAGILILQIDHGGKRVWIPERQGVVAMAGHLIEPGLPKRHVPHMTNGEAVRCAA